MSELNIQDIVTDYQSGKNKNKPAKPESYASKQTDKDGRVYDNKPGSPQWYWQQCSWLWWMYANNYTNLNFSTRLDMVNNRLYAEGRQPVVKYMPMWGRKDKQTNRWKTWTNISFDIYAVLPKAVSYIRGLFDKVDFNLSVNSINEESIKEREVMIAKEVAFYEDREFYESAQMLVGEQEQQQLPFVPKNKEQAQMLIDLGFVKLMDEAEMESKLNVCAVESRWEEVIKSKLHYDLAVQSIAATKAYRDPVTKQLLARYANIENMVLQYRNRDVFYQDINYIAEIRPYTIGDLRAAGFKDEALRAAIQYYQGKCGNPTFTDITQNGWFNPQWYDVVVYVLDSEFEAFDFTKYKWIDFEGEMKPVPIESGEEDISYNQNEPKPKIPMTSYPKWHRSKWVIGMGADGVFDEGFQFDVPYTQDNRPQSSYSVVRVNDRSLVSLCIADADEVQNLVLKRRAAVAKLIPPGTVFDRNALMEDEIGGQKFNWMQKIDAFNVTGDVAIKNPTTPTGQAIPGVPPPFIFHEGTIKGLEGYDRAITTAIMRIADKTGISTPIDGTAPDPDTPVTTTEIALQGSNNVLRPLLMGYKSLKKQTFDKLAGRLEINEKAQILETGIETPEDLLNFVNKRKYRLSVDAIIDEETKADILSKADLSLQAAKTGGVGIEYSDYFAVQGLVRRGLYKSAQLYLSWREDERRKHAEKMQADNMKMNQEMAIAVEEEKRKTAGMLGEQEVQAQAAMENNKANAQAVLDANKIGEQLKADLVIMFKELQNNLVEIKEQGKVDVMVEKAKPKPKPASAKT